MLVGRFLRSLRPVLATALVWSLAACTSSTPVKPPPASPNQAALALHRAATASLGVRSFREVFTGTGATPLSGFLVYEAPDRVHYMIQRGTRVQAVIIGPTTYVQQQSRVRSFISLPSESFHATLLALTWLSYLLATRNAVRSANIYSFSLHPGRGLTIRFQVVVARGHVVQITRYTIQGEHRGTLVARFKQYDGAFGVTAPPPSEVTNSPLPPCPSTPSTGATLSPGGSPSFVFCVPSGA